MSLQLTENLGWSIPAVWHLALAPPLWRCKYRHRPSLTTQTIISDASAASLLYDQLSVNEGKPQRVVHVTQNTSSCHRYQTRHGPIIQTELTGVRQEAITHNEVIATSRVIPATPAAAMYSSSPGQEIL